MTLAVSLNVGESLFVGHFLELQLTAKHAKEARFAIVKPYALNIAVPLHGEIGIGPVEIKVTRLAATGQQAGLGINAPRWMQIKHYTKENPPPPDPEPPAVLPMRKAG